jgi:hypothetical protein
MEQADTPFNLEEYLEKKCQTELVIERKHLRDFQDNLILLIEKHPIFTNTSEIVDRMQLDLFRVIVDMESTMEELEKRLVPLLLASNETMEARKTFAQRSERERRILHSYAVKMVEIEKKFLEKEQEPSKQTEEDEQSK